MQHQLNDVLLLSDHPSQKRVKVDSKNNDKNSGIEMQLLQKNSPANNISFYQET